MKKSKSHRSHHTGEAAPAAGTVQMAAEPVAESAADPTFAAELPTPEQIANWKAQAEKADDHWDRLLRAKADLENFRKRASRDKEEAIRYANQKLLQGLLPVLDSFDMAVSAAESGNADALESLQSGVNMIHQQLKSALGGAGLEEIDALGQPFDPNLHEAVSQLESDDAPEGSVAQQLRKGYRLRERLLRPASVIVARKPDA